MAKLTWDNIGERLFETGIQKGVVYPLSDAMYWNHFRKLCFFVCIL